MHHISYTLSIDNVRFPQRTSDFISDSSSNTSMKAITGADYTPLSHKEKNITIGKIQFHTAPDIQESLMLHVKITEYYMLTAHLESISKITSIPTL